MGETASNQGIMKVERVVALAFLFMMLGTAIELFLLDHYEDVLQLIPILCIALSLILAGILWFNRRRSIQVVFKLLLLANAASGVYGTFLHLNANLEFEQEMKPTAESWDVFVESLSGALPTLAPASMMVLALIGYAYLLLIKQRL